MSLGIAPGMAVCSTCDSVWYSSALLGRDEESSCEHCGGSLAPLPAEPFGDGPLYVPSEWVENAG